MVECYSGLYEEGEVDHINGPSSTHPFWSELIIISNFDLFKGQRVPGAECFYIDNRVKRDWQLRGRIANLYVYSYTARSR